MSQTRVFALKEHSESKLREIVPIFFTLDSTNKLLLFQ